MTVLVDYSAGQLTGANLWSAGVSGVIRYCGTPQYAKNTTPAEVASLHAAGLQVHGVFEVGTDDYRGGFNAGVANASLLSWDANRCGISGVLFMSADQHIPLSAMPNWVDYVRGAATVLGERLGVYGFSEAMVNARSHARFFWQCGSHPDMTGTANFVNVWQRNAGQTQAVISGVVCDLNDILIPLEVDVLLTDQLTYTSRVDGTVRTTTVGQALGAAVDLHEQYAKGFGGVGPAGPMADLLFAVQAAIGTVDAGVKALSGVNADALATALAGPLAAALIPHLPAGVKAADVVALMAQKLSS